MRAVTARGLVFYAGTILVLIAIILHLPGLVLPGSLASQLGHNSEAFLFALLVAAATEWRVRPRFDVRAGATLAAAAIASITGGLLLWGSSLPPAIATLNEPMIGAGLVMLYLIPQRPWRWAPWVSLATLIFIVVAFDTSVVLDQAESLVPFLLAPIALDVVHRSVLDPAQPQRPSRVVAWMIGLLAFAVFLILVAPWARNGSDSVLTVGIDYAQRAAEAYWGWLLLHAYFLFKPVRAQSPSVSKRHAADQVGGVR